MLEAREAAAAKKPVQTELEDAIAQTPAKKNSVIKPKVLPVDREPTDGEMIAKYLELRNYVQKMTEEHTAAIKPYTEAMVAIEGTLGQKMIDQDLTNIKAEGIGIAFRQKGTSIKVSDRRKFMDFVFEDPNGERFLTAHIAKEAAEEFMTANDGALPPGVEASTFYNTRFRKA